MICVICLIALEALSAYMLYYRSETYRRVSQQLVWSAGARPAGPGEPASVVMIGNSLFLHGVQVERLRELTSKSLRIYPIFLEGTGYYEWLYGLRRIFRLGARPQVVVVELDVTGFLWNGMRTEYSPMLFFDTPDVLNVGSDLDLDRTARSNLLLAHWSAFWNMHSVVRTQILRLFVPHINDLLFSITQAQRQHSIDPESEAIVEARLKTLQELCERYGAKMLMLAPPTLSSENALRKLVRVSRQLGVTTLVPTDPATLTARHYLVDGFHLNSEGAALFTAAIARISDHLSKSECHRRPSEEDQTGGCK